jgi:hypothetical protein
LEAHEQRLRERNPEKPNDQAFKAHVSAKKQKSYKGWKGKEKCHLERKVDLSLQLLKIRVILMRIHVIHQRKAIMQARKGLINQELSVITVRDGAILLMSAAVIKEEGGEIAKVKRHIWLEHRRNLLVTQIQIQIQCSL